MNRPRQINKKTVVETTSSILKAGQTNFEYMRCLEESYGAYDEIEFSAILGDQFKCQKEILKVILCELHFNEKMCDETFYHLPVDVQKMVKIYLSQVYKFDYQDCQKAQEVGAKGKQFTEITDHKLNMLSPESRQRYKTIKSLAFAV